MRALQKCGGNVKTAREIVRAVDVRSDQNAQLRQIEDFRKDNELDARAAIDPRTLVRREWLRGVVLLEKLTHGVTSIAKAGFTDHEESAAFRARLARLSNKFRTLAGDAYGRK